ncbi:glutathione-dependent formaldehyde-activating enzyme [Dactylonectria macrodidyma]|uniref:Glutathione-dependent formaldehyde-activating enzyme n=1 Tax=Dactylonectria macrodidyma TaxID=307937 RepID=A0A9P9EU89_9HYPO|nr:glutathione-dependent formaldehyde-activating enzyme [Dactylonectria macrodidyma]
MEQLPSLRISCLCGSVSQLVPSRPAIDTPPTLSLCHCNTCRYSTGLLCASYYPIASPSVPSGITQYEGADGWTRHFCSSCGCHVFRCRPASEQEVEWELATGVIIESLHEDGSPDVISYASHDHVSDTKDGGISVWIQDFQGGKMELVENAVPSVHPRASLDEDHLPASCDCGRVSFHITRPNSGSYLPRSNISDLISAYCSTDEAITQNPGDEKWWIRADGTKYLGGTCACRSCRLTSGFEIQTWAFVPQTNIFFHTAGLDRKETVVPLDFDALPAGTLTSYRSSLDVLREFCGSCGATVFWHDKWRPDLIDVSIGLFKASDGARAEGWIDWWTERVSFTEEVENGRSGREARRARDLIASLEEGLRHWGSRG